MSRRYDDSSEVEVSPQLNGVLTKHCDCGSPNCNSRVCIRNSFNKSPSNKSSDSIATLTPGFIRTIAEEEEEDDVDVDEKSHVVEVDEPKAPSPPPSPLPTVPTIVEEGEAASKQVPPEEQPQPTELTPPPVLEPTGSYNDPDWNRGCFCSFRDSKDHLLKRYIKHFTETMHYSKHLQKLKFGSKCDGRCVNAQCVNAQGTNCTDSRPRGCQRASAASRAINRTPFDFLNKTCMMRAAETIRQKPAPKKQEYIVINFPVCSNNVPNNYDEDLDLQKTDNGIDDLQEDPKPTIRCRKRCTSSGKKSPPCSNRQMPRHSSGSQVTFQNNIDMVSKFTEVDHTTELHEKIIGRKKTPFSPSPPPLSVASVGTQKDLGDGAAEDEDELEDEIEDTVEDESVDEVPIEEDNVEEQEEELQHESLERVDYCFQDAAIQKSINVLKEEQTATEEAKCVECGCCTNINCKTKAKAVPSTPLPSPPPSPPPPPASPPPPPTKPTFTKVLNDMSKGFAEKYCCTMSPENRSFHCDHEKCANCTASRLCLRKLFKTPARADRAKIMQEQKEQCMRKQVYCRNITFTGCGALPRPTCVSTRTSGVQKDATRCMIKPIKCHTMQVQADGNAEPEFSDPTIQCTQEFYECFNGHPNEHFLSSSTDLGIPPACFKFYPGGGHCSPKTFVDLDDADQDGDIPDDCTCGNFCHPECKEACAKPCTFPTHQYTLNTYTARGFKHPPYAEKCHGPRYCMNIQTPFKSFYPTTAVQVNSMELVQRPNARWSDKRRTTDLDTKQLKQYIKDAIETQMEDVVRDLQDLLGTPPMKDTSPSLPSPMSKESRQMKFAPQQYRNTSNASNPESEHISEETSVVPLANVVEKMRLRSSSAARMVPSVTTTPMTVTTPMAQNVSIHGPPLTPPPPEQGVLPSRIPRESKRVSMKYEFPLYNPDDTTGGAQGKPSATDSIEERIRILRQNLEQRREFDSETPSNRSQTTIMSLKERQVSVGDESDMTQISTPRNKLNSSGRVMKKL